ncbi:MAG: transcription antitermination factor NusB [Pseudoclavibacter sp.]
MAVVEPTSSAPKDDMSRPFSGRTLARQRAVEVLYSADLRGRGIPEAVGTWLANARDNLEQHRPANESESVRRVRAREQLDALDSYQYARTIAVGVDEHLQTIDELISSFANGWTIERMPRVDVAILRVGTWELLYNDEVPAPVAISEAGKLAAELSTADSSRFINGVLNGVAAGA